MVTSGDIPACFLFQTMCKGRSRGRDQLDFYIPGTVFFFFFSTCPWQAEKQEVLFGVALSE